jgi:hypothetical protein
MEELKSSLNEKKETIKKFENEIDDIKNSPEYKEYMDVKSKLSECDPEEVNIRHHVNEE